LSELGGDESEPLNVLLAADLEGAAGSDSGTEAESGHLNLDLELDEEIPFSIPPPTQDQASNPQTHINAPSTTSAHPTTYVLPVPASTPTYNPFLPFFFPSSSHPHNKISTNLTQDVISNWPDPAVSFFRTESEEAIRENGRRGRAS
jgi:hypothetical protein